MIQESPIITWPIQNFHWDDRTNTILKKNRKNTEKEFMKKKYIYSRRSWSQDEARKFSPSPPYLRLGICFVSLVWPHSWSNLDFVDLIGAGTHKDPTPQRFLPTLKIILFGFHLSQLAHFLEFIEIVFCPSQPRSTIKIRIKNITFFISSIVLGFLSEILGMINIVKIYRTSVLILIEISPKESKTFDKMKNLGINHVRD